MQYSKEFDKAYHQYVIDYEGSEDGDEIDELGSHFDALLVEGDTDEEEEAFFTSIGSISSGKQLIQDLANRACSHQVTAYIPHLTLPDAIGTRPDSIPEEPVAFATGSRYDSTTFYGIVIDTGASKFSTAGFDQFQALQRTDHTVLLDETTKGKVTVQFGIGESSSIGSSTVNTPIGQVEFHIMLAKTPFLLCLADMDTLSVYFNNLTNTLVTPQGSVPTVRRFGHSFLLWDSSLQNFISESFNYTTCYLTNTELQRLHRRFGHPSVGRLQRVLERAGHQVDKEVLEYLSKYCTHCQRHGQAPGRFKFNLRDDVQFNYCIIVDIFYIEGKPVLHVVDEATRYQAGRWLLNISAKHTWDAIRACWIDTYLGPPDMITTDSGKNFASKEFNQLASTVGTKVKIVPVEAHNSVGIVERYHGLIRRAYTIISIELRDIDKDMALQMAFKAINDLAGPDGLVPTLLVYGAYPRLSETDLPAPTVTQRALAIKRATTEIQKLRAKRQVSEAINTRNGPSTSDIHDLTINSEVLVWREGNGGQNGKWTGPYKLISTDGESCVLALPYGHTTFRSTVVKPYLTPDEPIGDIELPDSTDKDTITVAVPEPLDTPIQETHPPNPPNPLNQPAKRGRGRPRKYPIGNPADITIFIQDEPTDKTHLYTNSRRSEIDGLLEKGVFTVASLGDIPPNTRIFKARFVDEIKNKGTEKAFEKSRLVVQAYHDDGKHMVLTQSPTIQRVSQRIIICLAAVYQKGLYLRDISQAYVQSTTQLNRDFYIKPPYELTDRMGLPRDTILKVVKPLYGVPEAGNHWFKTYHTHHTVELGMEQSTYDPCLVYRKAPFGVVGIQTDDTLFTGDVAFATLEAEKIKKAQFLAKDCEQLATNKSLKFNGGIIALQDDGSITLT
jgi:hypothetical protein